MVNDQEILLKMMKAKFIVSGDEVIAPEVGDLIFNKDDNQLYSTVPRQVGSGVYKCYLCSLSLANSSDSKSHCPGWTCENNYFVRVDD